MAGPHNRLKLTTKMSIGALHCGLTVAMQAPGLSQSTLLSPCPICCTGNMMLFDAEGKIRRYETPEQIVQEFFDLRLSFYAKRKAALLKASNHLCYASGINLVGS
jgi:hypothetical protein